MTERESTAESSGVNQEGASLRSANQQQEPGLPPAALAWIVGDDTGISSKAIWARMMGVSVASRDWGWGDWNCPADPSDFGRCYRLLLLMPEWRVRLGEMAQEGELWARLIAVWDELTALYEQEAGDMISQRHGWKAPLLYARMKALGT